MLNNFREGGNAIKDAVDVPTANVMPTIEAYIIDVISKLDHKAWAKIGSTGKKKIKNGDIDLAFDTDLSLEELSAELDKLGIEHVVSKGFHELNTKFHQYSPEGEGLPEFAQVDLMVGNLDWLQFAYFTAPEAETHYKAKHHTATLFGLLRGTDIEGDDGSLTGWSMAVAYGVFNRKSIKYVNKKGNEDTKAEKLSGYFPSPKVFCEVISERSLEPWSPEDLMDTCEAIWEKIKQRYSPEQQHTIFKTITRWCANQEIEVPDLMPSLQEALDHIITKEKLHQTHAEDMVLYGAEGIEFTLETFESLFHQLQTGEPTVERNLSVKADGAPVVFAGKSFAHIKVPFVAAKAILAKNAKYATNEEELVELFGNRPGLLLKMRALLKYVPAIGFPEGECWRGDFLFAHDALQHLSIEGKEYVTMHPNSLYYATQANSDLAARVEEAEIGVVWHTRYNGEDVTTAEPIYSTDVSELNDIPQVFQTDPYLRSLAGGVFTHEEESKIEHLLDFAHQAKEELLQSDDYSTILADEDFIKNFFTIFENHKVRSGAIGIDPLTFIPELMEWSIGRFEKKIASLKTDKARASYEEKKAQFLELLESRKDTLLTMLDLMKDIAEVKDMFVDKLNHFGMFETFYKTMSDGAFHRTGQEGFVISDTIGNSLKLINRAEFSHLNFSPDTENGWKVEAETFNEDAPKDPMKIEAYLANQLGLVITKKSSTTWSARDPENERKDKAIRAQRILKGELQRDGKDLILPTGIKIEFKDEKALKQNAKHEDNVETRYFRILEENFNRALGARKSINVQIKGQKKTMLIQGVAGVKVVEGTPKADFAFVDKAGYEIYYISHKAGTTPAHYQQYGGLKDLKDSPAWDLIAPELAKKIRKTIRGVEFGSGLAVKKSLKNTGPEGQIKKLAAYGQDYNSSAEGPQNVSAIIQGEISFTPAGSGTYDLNAAHVYLNGENMSGDADPVFIVRYDSERDSLIGGIKFVNARAMIVPEAYTSGRNVINILEASQSIEPGLIRMR